MTSQDLAHSDLVKARVRLKALALKAMLRAVGVQPPKFHDVGSLLLEHRTRFHANVGERLFRVAEIS